MMNAVHPDLAFFFLRDGEKLILKGVESTKHGKWLEETPEHRVGECLCGLAARERKPIYSRDISTDDRCTWEECRKAGFRSFAALPLLSGAEVIGVVGIASYGERDFQTQAEFLETLASQAAIALENARLFEQVKNELTERKRAEEALRQSEARLLASLRIPPTSLSGGITRLAKFNTGTKLPRFYMVGRQTRRSERPSTHSSIHQTRQRSSSVSLAVSEKQANPSALTKHTFITGTAPLAGWLPLRSVFPWAKAGPLLSVWMWTSPNVRRLRRL
jgi:putative methionine-R-sulfoxide reductase with GAF domain